MSDLIIYLVMNLYAAVPFLPVLPRLLMAVCFYDILFERWSKREADVPHTRDILIGLCGLTFAGVVAITVLKPDDMKSLKVPMFFLLTSFVCCFLALGLQGYKVRVILEMVSDTLIDAAGISLLAFVVAFLHLSPYGVELKSTAVFLIAVAWLADFVGKMVTAYLVYRDKNPKKG